MENASKAESAKPRQQLKLKVRIVNHLLCSNKFIKPRIDVLGTALVIATTDKTPGRRSNWPNARTFLVDAHDIFCAHIEEAFRCEFPKR
ncbi:MAG: hypothetical protein GTO26_12380 [Planctomycetales bacterium]|nr:hypothetical protein [Planctomycetales bacterium]